MSHILRISTACDKLDASPEDATRHINNDTNCLSPRVKYNEEFNGYHFHSFNEEFICREELPQGSETFRQVIDELTNALDAAKISEQPKRLPVTNNRRKSVATVVHRRGSDISVGKSTKKRRVSWEKPTYYMTHTPTSSSLCRPRICSDGAVMLRRTSLQCRHWKTGIWFQTTILNILKIVNTCMYHRYCVMNTCIVNTVWWILCNEYCVVNTSHVWWILGSKYWVVNTV